MIIKKLPAMLIAALLIVNGSKGQSLERAQGPSKVVYAELGGPGVYLSATWGITKGPCLHGY